MGDRTAKLGNARTSILSEPPPTRFQRRVQKSRMEVLRKYLSKWGAMRSPIRPSARPPRLSIMAPMYA